MTDTPIRAINNLSQVVSFHPSSNSDRIDVEHETTVDASVHPADHAEVLHFGFTQLIDFLQQYKDKQHELHMVCPWGGVPLPSIDLTLEPSVGSHLKIELSLKTSEALLQFVSGGLVSEVPDRRSP
jgi:hypothetical protein